MTDLPPEQEQEKGEIVATYQVTITVRKTALGARIGKVATVTNDTIGTACSTAIENVYGYSRAGAYVSVAARSTRTDK